MVEKALLMALIALALVAGVAKAGSALEKTFCKTNAAFVPETVICLNSNTP